MTEEMKTVEMKDDIKANNSKVETKKKDTKSGKNKKSDKTEIEDKAIELKRERLRTRKEVLSEDYFRKRIKNHYLEIFVLSDNKVIDHFKISDLGQDWVRSEKMNRCFLIPDRSEGLSEGIKTMFFFDAHNISPLTKVDKKEMDDQNVIYTFDRNSDSKIKKFKFYMNANTKHYQRYNPDSRKIEPVYLKPTMIDSALVDKILNTEVVNKFLKIPSNMWEDLKIPIIVVCIAIVIITMLFTL